MVTRGGGSSRARSRADAHRSASSSSSLNHTNDVDVDASAPSDDPRLIFLLKKHFKWDELDDAIYPLWSKKAARRYSNWVHDIKEDGRRPPFIPEIVWPSWQRYWNSEKFRQISAQAHNNRMSERDGPGTGIITHKGGTRSAVEYALDYAKRDGVSMNEVAWNVFNVFHPPDETASNSKSARISADVHRKAMEQTQSGNTHPDMNSIFLDVAREESKKNRMFDLGCMETSSRGQSSGQSSEVSSQANHSLEELTQKIKEDLREELKEEMRANMEAFRAEFIANYRPPPPE